MVQGPQCLTFEEPSPKIPLGSLNHDETTKRRGASLHEKAAKDALIKILI